MADGGTSCALGEAGGDEQIIAGSWAVPDAGGGERILVVPWGQVESLNGSFVLDEQAVEAVLDAHRAHGIDLPIDYEHQSLGGAYASPNGQAPAAGWIRSLEVVSPDQASEAQQAGLYAQVEWTPAARARLDAREYRYLSPVVLVRRSDRRVMALHSAALTNKPAIPAMPAIVNSQDAREGLEVLRGRLGLGSEAAAGQVLVAAAERIAELDRQAAQQQAEALVAGAAKAGKLAPAQHRWAMELATVDPECFRAWETCAPVLMVTGRTQPPAAGGSGGPSRAAVIAKAKAAWQAEPLLARVTDEAAWVALALKDAGLDAQG